ncbi:hypothetical protein QA612_08155 [Evansella sp. AB-P1]|uniref:hypothetical protein n=1 Tax=Evansella sp. AB-P1 TaxID=3037653 RepID=UPI00241DA6AC|nr:hypothetical protein [Evansella sp. AB-P1]MDG5787466.1 hypothetical protein [Evansella sp. AB-P1]
MIFEFSNDIVPILLSFSFCFSIITFHLMNGLAKETFVSHRELTNSNLDLLTWSTLDQTEVLEEIGQVQTFITRIIKRKEAPEDDADYTFFPYNHQSFYNQGGQKWEKHLYSTSLKGIAF